MKKKYTRRLSSNERLWLIADESCPPYMNQLVLEGEGQLDIDQWRNAVAKASEANPGTRLILKNGLGYLKWIDSGITPPIREVDGSKWSGCDFENAPFVREPLSPIYGPTCEIVFIHGNPFRIAFRTYHAAMDMRGTFVWIDDIIHALRNEPLSGSDSRISDYELAKQIRNKKIKPAKLDIDFIAPTGKAIGSEKGFDWRRIQLKGQYSNLLAQVCLLGAKEAWKHSDGNVRFAIPVDIRTRRPEIRSTGNLSIPIYIDIRSDSTLDEIAQNIRQQLKSAQECSIPWIMKFYKYIPLRMLKNNNRALIPKCYARGKFLFSGLLSNINRIPLEIFSAGGFTATGLFGIPPGLEYVPTFMGFASYNDTLEVVVTMPKVFANEGRIDTFLEVFRNGLVPQK